MNKYQMAPTGSTSRRPGLRGANPGVWLAGIVLAIASTASGQIIQEFPQLPAGRAPEGIVLGPDGNLWIC